MKQDGNGEDPSANRPVDDAGRRWNFPHSDEAYGDGGGYGGRTKIMSHGRGSAQDQETRRDPEAAEEAPNCQSAFNEDGDITPV